ncbi:Stromal cell-derived factor 2-like protein 1 [Entomortierella beljakovae]|nr:Stromal cell-derived factor 2-like protein 1 [Entomortierella beljakovae]
MLDDHYEDLLPLRIQAYPYSIIDIIPSKNLAEKTNQNSESPPKYNHTEMIQSMVLPFTNHSNQSGDEYVRFGSRISLRHACTGGYLHSVNWKYETPPKPYPPVLESEFDEPSPQSPVHTPVQYAVQGTRSGEPGPGDFWQVVPVNGDITEINDMAGKTIQYGTRVCLFNMMNKRYLHSHNFLSPITNQQEVTTHESENGSCAGGVWIVMRFENGTEYWKSSELFILRHELTNHYLHSHMSFYMGEHEVTTFHNLGLDTNNLWRVRFA